MGGTWDELLDATASNDSDLTGEVWWNKEGNHVVLRTVPYHSPK